MNVYLMGMVISMIVYIVLGLVISRQVKGVNDFFVAGRQAPTFFNCRFSGCLLLLYWFVHG